MKKDPGRYECNKEKIAQAKNPNTPIEILEKLAIDESYWVRGAITLNENFSTNDYLSSKLSRDKEVFVRLCVARSIYTPPVILEELANDEHWQVRRLLTENQNTPFAVVEKLSKDEEKLVKISAVRRLLEEKDNLLLDSEFNTNQRGKK